MDKLLSVIVPCYNDGKYIERCLNSILNQKYSNIEVLVVNDGSTDNTEGIIKSIDDVRIKYFYKENSGVSDARNMGLDNAKGELITFVDSDDTIEPEMYSELIKLMNEVDADISHCSYNKIENNIVRKISGKGNVCVFDTFDGIYHFFMGDLYAGGIWNKIFKASLIKKTRFETEIKMNEDVLFFFFALKKTKKTVFIDKCFYNYYVSDTSSCVNTNMIKIAEDGYIVNDIILKSSIGERYEDLAELRSYGSLLGLYRAYSFYGNPLQKLKAKDIKKELVKIYSEKKLRGNLKINVIMIKYLGILYKPFYGIYNRFRKPNWDINEVV